MDSSLIDFRGAKDGQGLHFWRYHLRQSVVLSLVTGTSTLVKTLSDFLRFLYAVDERRGLHRHHVEVMRAEVAQSLEISSLRNVELFVLALQRQLELSLSDWSDFLLFNSAATRRLLFKCVNLDL